MNEKTSHSKDRLWPAYEVIEDQLEAWCREYPRYTTLERLGTTAQGRTIRAICLTDKEVNPENKEHVLFTATHTGGRERSGATGLLYVIRWLLSDDSLAREILTRQVVVCMPVPNPDGYMTEGVGNHNNSHGLNPCDDWTLDGPMDPEHNPEGMVLKGLMDRYQPEVDADFHGVDLTFPGHIMTESSGPSYGCTNWRPYHLQITRLMEQAAQDEGFPSDMVEEDAERSFWGDKINDIAHKLWLGRPNTLAGPYCYARYHTLTFTSEVLWEQSGLIRHKRLLQVGQEVWPGEYYPGYPTRVIQWNNFDLITAYGPTAAQRRKSRVELWNKQQQLRDGFINPEREGLKFHVCITSPQASDELLRDPSLKSFARKIQEHPEINTSAILPLLEHYPNYSGQWGSEANVCTSYNPSTRNEFSPIEHGLGIRLRIPYPKARLDEVRVNGHVINPSETDGFLTWTARGFTYLQINIPPDKSRQRNIFIITCPYDPGVKYFHPRIG